MVPAFMDASGRISCPVAGVPMTMGMVVGWRRARTPTNVENDNYNKQVEKQPSYDYSLGRSMNLDLEMM